MTKASNRSTILGIIFIALGALFLLDNLRILPYTFFDYFFNWKGIILAVGAIIIATNKNKTPGIIMVAVGGFFIFSEILAYEFGLRWISSWRLFWPLIIILVGIIILTRRSKPSSITHGKNDNLEDPDELDVTAILSGGDITVNSKKFKGGKVTAILGGGNYDLSNTELAADPQVIDLFTLFGGATFIVPSDWDVHMEVTSIFGGFSDKRKITATTSTDITKQLVIRGTVIFGGVDLKNYV